MVSPSSQSFSRGIHPTNVALSGNRLCLDPLVNHNVSLIFMPIFGDRPQFQTHPYLPEMRLLTFVLSAPEPSESSFQRDRLSSMHWQPSSTLMLAPCLQHAASEEVACYLDPELTRKKWLEHVLDMKICLSATHEDVADSFLWPGCGDIGTFEHLLGVP